MGKKMIEYVSIAKAIGIILVVAGHCIDGKITNFIYLFHMPMFFMISGYLFTSGKNIRIYVKRKIQAIYVPYVICNVFFLILHNAFFDIGFYKEGILNLQKLDFVSFVKDVIGIISLTHMEQVTAPTWYLRVLLISSIIFMLLNKYVNRKKHIIIMLTLYILVYFLYYRNLINNSITIYSTLILLAVVFMYWGKIYKIIENKIQYRKSYIILSFISLMTMNEFGHINIVSIEWENPVFLLLSAFLGTFLVFGISSMLEKTKLKNVMVLVGNHTLIILLLHCAVFKIINLIHCYIGGNVRLYAIANADSFLWAVFYIAGGVFIPLAIELTFDRIKKRGKSFEKR